MLNTEHFELLAGNPGAWDIEMTTRCKAGESQLLVQEDQHARGRRSAHLVESMYGFTVRFASGLDDFRIIRKGFVTTHDAVSFGMAWANEEASNREFFARKSDLA